MIGGAKYNAQVQVNNCKNAEIQVNNNSINQGENFLQKRNKPLEILITNSHSVDSVLYTFNDNKFRLGLLCGSGILGTGVIAGVPIPWALCLDYLTGSAYEPRQTSEVVKTDFDHFVYKLDFGGCE